MKNIWIIANWKSNKNIAEALEWLEKVGPQLPKKDNLKVVVCPTFSVLSEMKKALKDYPITLGAQDLSPFEVGAYTGEESAGLLKDLINFSIIGHSERRKNFGEDDSLISKKVQQAMQNGITPILCVQGEETAVSEGCKLVAYEPVWAIGSGTPDTPDNANQVASSIKQKTDQSTEILYGGSVNSENVLSFLKQEYINGVLIGGASLSAEEFIQICKAAESV